MSLESRLDHTERNKKERRRINTFPPPKYLIKGNRKEIRRESDTNGKYYTDHRKPWLSFLIIFIIVLSVFDWGLTLIHLNRGAIELNPIMAMAIEVGEGYFFFLKYAVTSVGLFILYLCKDFFPTPKIVVSISVIYSSLILYHIMGYYLMSS